MCAELWITQTFGTICEVDGVAQTVNLDHIKRHYYITHQDINPTQFVPIGPDIDFEKS